jgi:hypothetical protein
MYYTIPITKHFECPYCGKEGTVITEVELDPTMLNKDRVEFKGAHYLDNAFPEGWTRDWEPGGLKCADCPGRSIK